MTKIFIHNDLYNDANILAYNISKTASLVTSTESCLLIIHETSYQKLSKDTARRWILEMLNRAGINTSIYKVHSTRLASS